MVDFKKMLEQSKLNGKFLGYCPDCDTHGRIYEIHIIESYRGLPREQQKAMCPICKRYCVVDDLIPF